MSLQLILLCLFIFLNLLIWNKLEMIGVTWLVGSKIFPYGTPVDINDIGVGTGGGVLSPHHFFEK